MSINLNKLLKTAQGSRSQNNFAKDCSISASTLSRIIINGQKPTPEILRSISEHACGGVAYLDLMIACDYIKKSDFKDKGDEPC